MTEAKFLPRVLQFSIITHVLRFRLYFNHIIINELQFTSSNWQDKSYQNSKASCKYKILLFSSKLHIFIKIAYFHLIAVVQWMFTVRFFHNCVVSKAINPLLIIPLPLLFLLCSLASMWNTTSPFILLPLGTLVILDPRDIADDRLDVNIEVILRLSVATALLRRNQLVFKLDNT